MTLFVPGTPRPQGSKSRASSGRMYEASKYLKAWRRDVTLMAARHFRGVTLKGEVRLALDFVMPRPLRASDLAYVPCAKKPDIDKLERAIMDALTDAGAWKDDCQVVAVAKVKRTALAGETPGVWIDVSPFAPPSP